MYPKIYELACNETGIKQFKEDLSGRSNKEKEILLDYPTVYLFDWKEKEEYEAYVGETSNIIRRTNEHLTHTGNGKEDWHGNLHTKPASMFIIGHDHFNKSLTLDIENRMMLYLSGVEKVKKLHNQRENAQNKYYTSDQMDTIFSEIWRKLQQRNPDLFPVEAMIRDSAIFKASPFHKLTAEQYKAKDEIMSKVKAVLASGKKGQIIFVTGEAGTGKTVLNSSIFYELISNHSEIKEKLNAYLLVNHDQQLTVYKQIAEKLDLLKENENIVSKPTQFINRQSAEEPVDVVLVDEAHLLWTQGKQAYRGKNQLFDILDRARAVIVMFDRKQILRTEQYWEFEAMEELENRARETDCYIELKNQLRINAEPDTIKWIRDIIDNQKIHTIPEDRVGYEIKIFDTPVQLQKEISKKARRTDFGLSRLVATFDWDYVDKTSPRILKYWEVKIGEWKMPWNLQLSADPKDRKKNKKLCWAEQVHTINEVGSTFTVQGFDLNYVGVILGPSVKYREGRIIFDPSCSKNKKATQNRTMSDGSTRNFSEELIRNQINVLLTRGVNGLYIYAQDDCLRKALREAGATAPGNREKV